MKFFTAVAVLAASAAAAPFDVAARQESSSLPPPPDFSGVPSGPPPSGPAPTGPPPSGFDMPPAPSAAAKMARRQESDFPPPPSGIPSGPPPDFSGMPTGPPPSDFPAVSEYSNTYYSILDLKLTLNFLAYGRSQARTPGRFGSPTSQRLLQRSSPFGSSAIWTGPNWPSSF